MFTSTGLETERLRDCGTLDKCCTVDIGKAWVIDFAYDVRNCAMAYSRQLPVWQIRRSTFMKSRQTPTNAHRNIRGIFSSKPVSSGVIWSIWDSWRAATSVLAGSWNPTLTQRSNTTWKCFDICRGLVYVFAMLVKFKVFLNEHKAQSPLAAIT